MPGRHSRMVPATFLGHRSAPALGRDTLLVLEMAGDKAIEAAQACQDAMLGAKAQVIAQYGSNSHAVQAIGLKRKSERRRPTRRAQSAS
jgi:hypothetical protein